MVKIMSFLTHVDKNTRVWLQTPALSESSLHSPLSDVEIQKKTNDGPTEILPIYFSMWVTVEYFQGEYSLR